MIDKINSIPLHQVYSALGIFSSICFGVQYLPQMYLNYQRRSVQGFSATGIIIKLIGASFLLINSWLIGESLPVVFYGLINVIQHTIFMFQFSIYDPAKATKYLPWVMFPIIPYLIGYRYPQTMYFTNSIKPITQVLSHLPQVILCYRSKSTLGVSLPSQYLNLFGGVAGVLMCIGIPPVSRITYFIYAFSVVQAISLFLIYFYYDIIQFKKNNKSSSNFGV
ncbi:hypothetical protein CYY_007752 [Polysphondylium violaceum]|uniref:Transmembrane protein n=1 Tax=Polysphondylium violaceum TaxID=133409 RepID=A0A8J4PPA6_9MYCE|nr:hypothetical protein CYY_007752 [Polysphondylium violaceum]